MIKIGVISDTHLVSGKCGLRKLAAQVVSKSMDGFELIRLIAETQFKNNVERIIHCGDIVDFEVIELLEEYAPVDAVCGNMDGPELRGRLPEKKVIDIEGHSIGIIHGWGSPNGIMGRIRNEFGDIQALVYGHTHAPMNRKLDGVLFFNPGSPIDKRFGPFRAVGMLYINRDGITGEIIKVEDLRKINSCS